MVGRIRIPFQFSIVVLKVPPFFKSFSKSVSSFQVYVMRLLFLELVSINIERNLSETTTRLGMKKL